MNWKLKIAVLVGLVSLASFSFGQNTEYFYLDKPFAEGEKVYLFGDNVKLRLSPNTESEVVDLLPIASQAEILSKSKEVLHYNGKDWPWYKVKAGDKTGFVLGGLLSLTHLKGEFGDFLFTYKIQEDQQTTLLVRHVHDQGKTIETVLPLLNTTFSLSVTGNFGLQDLVNIVEVDYMAEACGVEGGQSLVFYNFGSLVHAIDLSVMGDADVYSISENLIFPNQTGGKEGRLIYTKKEMELREETTNWTETTSVSRELQWIDGEIVPQIDSE